MFGLTNTVPAFSLEDMRSVRRTDLRTLDRDTVGDIALVCLADAVVGFSFGAVAVAGGLPLWQPVLMSVIVFAGGAQFAAVGAVLAGGSATTGAIAGLVLNARLLPYGFAVLDVLDGSWHTRLLGAHLTTDETVAFTLHEEQPQRRRAVFWTCALGLFTVWNLAVLAGASVGGMVKDTGAFGLDAAFPAVLAALVLPTLNARNRNAAVAGAGLAVFATPFLPPGLPVLVALAGLLLRREPKP
jgi:4-azaleucine resistance transporter AzlC